jgi:uncharacterized membrane protein YtjA (UPF0391 family)
MLPWIFAFLLLALATGLCGFSGIASLAQTVAEGLIVVALVIWFVNLLHDRWT